MKRAVIVATVIAGIVAAMCHAQEASNDADLLAIPDPPPMDAPNVAYLPELTSRYQVQRRIVVAEDGAVDAPRDESEVIEARTDGVELEIVRMGVPSRFNITSRDPVAVWSEGKPKLTGAYRGIRVMTDGGIEQIVVTEGTLTIVTTGSAIQTVTTVFADRISDQPNLETAWTTN